MSGENFVEVEENIIIIDAGKLLDLLIERHGSYEKFVKWRNEMYERIGILKKVK